MKLCYRCLKVYDINKIELTRNKRHKDVMEKKCPYCKCVVYFS
ncbi:hypothetical protein PQC36_gp124 [Proteus phage Vb_PmiP-P59]|uniref:Uncharacterized protein n=2 Tax=Privateervirus TaxID=2843440 RepID=A0A679FGD6_9CAUD|nr:hypothetical protein HWB19_gp037 [Cronobacter phage vB_CsaP_009]YP_010672251.1 hypothetical protein PQC36_gp124 [Proteus phage Vb_PmiP-P59]QMV48294.1 hypothetical protein [Proteus phage Vb_PmiP-P59]BBU72683.1 hypothetical protein [Cronobacter phage vB_CsaP_009]